jgi:hypothetical protein
MLEDSDLRAITSAPMTIGTTARNRVESFAAFSLGVFAGATAFGPLFGPIGGLPASFISLAMLPAALVALFISGSFLIPPRRVWMPITALSIIVALALARASTEQLVFFASPPWSERRELYVEAKLLVAVITILPPAFAAVILAVSPNKKRTIDGVLCVMAALACAAAVRAIGPNLETLIRTDLLTAHQYYRAEHGYSAVSYGILLTVGAVGALRFKGGWVIAGLLLFSTALLNRRADTFALTAVLVGLFAAYSVRAQRPAGYTVLAAALIGGALFLALHNGHNEQHFSGLSRALDHRVEMINDALAVPTDKKPTEGGPVIYTFQVVEQPPAALTLLAGSGLGRYQEITGSRFEYPHNLPLELFLELGLIAALAFGAAALLPLSVAGWRTIQGTVSTEALLCAACLALMVANTLKAGDLTSLGRVVFLSTLTLLAVASPEPSARGTV